MQIDLEIFMMEIALLPLTFTLKKYCYCDNYQFATRDASRMLTYEASYQRPPRLKGRHTFPWQ